jgi:hypothetical protein
MAWLDTLTKNLPPTLLIRGNHKSVLTFYSWAGGRGQRQTTLLKFNFWKDIVVGFILRELVPEQTQNADTFTTW